MTGKHLEWSEAFTTDIASLDEQHKSLINCAHAFIEALEIEAGYDTVYRLFHKLADEAIQHFAYEEQIMANIGLETLDDHIKEHDDLRNEMTRIGRLIETQSSAEDWKSMASMIQVWVLRHIMASDTKIREHLHRPNNEF